MGNNWLNEKIKRYLFGDISDDEVRQRMYNNLLPWGYHTPIKRVRKTVKRNEPEHQGNVYGVTDDVFAEYLQIPKEERRKPVLDEYLVTNSKYVPQKSSSIKVYKTLQGLNTNTFRGQSIRDEIVHKAPQNINENIVTSTQNLIGPFGDFTIGRGFDNKGEYVSYYDSYDINPLKGRFRSSLIESKQDDLTFGIGKPVEYYDRIYLDDYYDIPEEARGNPFITPAVVTAYKKGGRIHIKKKNRGKFTEYCGGKVTKECIRKGKNSSNPTIRKRAVFAQNSRRWKHLFGGTIPLIIKNIE